MLVTRTSKLERCARLAETRGRRLAVALLGSPAQADDLLQQALLVASRKAADVPAVMLWPWLARVITFEARNLRRREAGPLGASPLLPESQGPTAPNQDDPLEQVLRRELRERLAAAYDSLEPDQREALALVFGGEMSIRAAAKAAGVPRSTFQRRVDDGIAVLRSRLGVGRQSALGLLGAHLNWLWQQAGPSGVGLTGATAGGTTSGSGATAASTLVATGVAIMSIKKAAALVTAAVLVALGAWWAWPSDDKQEADGGAARERITQPGPAVGGRGVRDEPVAPAPESGERVVESPAPALEPKDTQPAKVWRPFEMVIRGEVVVEGATDYTARLRVVPSETEPELSDPIVSTEKGVSRPLPSPRADLQWPDDVRVSESLTATTGREKFEFTFKGERLVLSSSSVTAELPLARLVASVEGSPDWISELLSTEHARTLPDGTRVAYAGIHISPPVNLSGTARWLHDLKPVAGARIGVNPRVTGNMVSGIRRHVASIPELVTGDDGTFNFKGVLGRSSIQVRGAPPGMEILDYLKQNRFGATTPLMYHQSFGDRNEDVGDKSLILAQLSELTFRLAPDDASEVQVMLHPTPMRPEAEATRKLHSVARGADGLFRVSGLHSGHNRLVLKVSGYEIVDMPLSPVLGKDLDLGIIHLDLGSILLGRVTDRAGEPVAGARIVVAWPDSGDYKLRGEIPPDEVAVTDEDGIYKAGGLGEGLRLVWLFAKDFAVQCSTLEVKHGGTYVKDMTVSQGGVVEGLLLLDKPLAMNVFLHSESERPGNYYARLIPTWLPRIQAGDHPGQPASPDSNYWRAWSSTLTRVEGRRTEMSFRIVGVPPGQHNVRLGISVDPALAHLREQRGVMVADGQVAKLVFDLRAKQDEVAPALGSISGRVIGKDGKPLAGVEVSIGNRPKIAAITDEIGNYRLVGVEPGEKKVVLAPVASGGSSSERRLAPSKMVWVHEGRESVVEFDLTVSSGVVIHARVLLEGKPAFSYIGAVLMDKMGDITQQSGTSENLDKEGRATLWLPQSGFHTIWATGNIAGSYVRAAFQVETAPGEEISVERDLKLGWLIGTVNPPPGAASDFHLGGATIRHCIPLPFEHFEFSSQLSSVNVNSDGTFRVPVIEGITLVRATYPGYGPAYVSVNVVGETPVQLNLGGRVGSVSVKCEGVTGESSNLRARQRWRLRLLHNDNLSFPGRGYSTGFAESVQGETATAKDVPPGEYVAILYSLTHDQASLTGANVRQEPDPDNPGESRWIITVLPGSETTLSVSLTAK